MTEFAPVCPIHIMRGLQREGFMGRYHLPLAHDVLRFREDYFEVFADIRNRFQDHTIILDNSVIELGTAVNIEVIAEAASIVQANVIVLPDVLLDSKLTVTACQAAIEKWTPILNERLKHPWSYMIVPQGRWPGEWAWCAEQFKDTKLIGWWGIPRNYNIKGLGSRRDAIDIAMTVNSERKIHLLGFSDNIVDDILSAQHPSVTGIDSAVPIRAASLDLKMSMGLDDKLPPRGDWWDDPETQFTYRMVQNIQTVRDWIGSKDA